MVRLEVGVLECFLDCDTLAWGEGEAATHEVKRVGLGLGAHFAQVAAAVEGEGTLVSVFNREEECCVESGRWGAEN